MPCKRGKAKPIPKDLRDRSFRDDLRGLSFRAKDLSDANFSEMNLRGVDFSKAILRGAKFINADIRGANFSHAFLEEADFEGAEAGYTQAWTTFAAIVWIPLSIWTIWIVSTIGSTITTVGYVVGYSFFLHLCRFSSLFYQSIKASNLFSQPKVAFQLIKEDFHLLTKDFFKIRFLLDLLTMGIFSSLFLGYSHENKEERYSLNVFRNIDGRKSRIFVFSIPVFCVFISASNIFSFFGISTFECSAIPESLERDVCSFYSSLPLLLPVGLTGAVYNDFLCIHTTFRGAELEKSKFDKAYLPRADFRKSKLRLTSWKNCFIRDFSLIPGSGFGFYPFSTKTYLEDTKLRDILINLDGRHKIFDNKDLTFINFSGCDLSYASLASTNLDGADLQKADLSNARLVRTNLTNANLSGAILTGACIQDWHISLFHLKTKFDNAKCDYIFLDDNCTPESRRPLVGNFADGDFSKIYGTLDDALDLLFHQGDNPVAFLQALAKLRQENPTTRIDYLERDELVIVKIGNLPETVDKVETYRSFEANVERLTRELEAERRQRYMIEGRYQEQGTQIDRLEREREREKRERERERKYLTGKLLQMAEAPQPKYNFPSAEHIQIIEDNNGQVIAVQHNHASDPEVQSAISDLQTLIEELREHNPTVTTEAQALTIIDAEFTEIKQSKDHKLITLRKQLLNPERHLQATKSALGEIAKHYLEESVWAKTIITYLDKLSEEPSSES